MTLHRDGMSIEASAGGETARVTVSAGFSGFVRFDHGWGDRGQDTYLLVNLGFATPAESGATFFAVDLRVPTWIVRRLWPR